MPIRRLLPALLLVPVLLAITAPAGAGPRTDIKLVRETNEDRAEKGLRPLRRSHTLTMLARSHSVAMARRAARAYGGRGSRQALYHNNISGRVHGWTWIGQNVGCGTIVGGRMGRAADRIQGAFLRSRGHRANILYPGANRVGVGTYAKDGILWVTVNFMRVRTG